MLAKLTDTGQDKSRFHQRTDNKIALRIGTKAWLESEPNKKGTPKNNMHKVFTSAMSSSTNCTSSFHNNE